ncbi:MAG TPA: AI-2E family transporter, partial [Clostridia bacterium]|nr:AI-2E family transporter [Clostridia bacterium]
GGVWSTAKAVPEIAVAILVSIVACFFMTADFDFVTDFIKRQLPENKRQAVSATKRITVSAIGKLAKSYALILLLTFGEMVVGLNILRMIGLYKSSFLLATAVVVALVDIVPILGTGTILIPWAIYSLIAGNTGLGIGLLILYAIIYVIRQMVEPKLVAANLGLPPILTLMAMYVGAKLFGFIGLFLLPLTIMLIKIFNDEGLVNLWKPLSTKSDPKGASPAEDTESEPDSVKS